MVKQIALFFGLLFIIGFGACKKTEVIEDPAANVDNHITATVNSELVEARFKVLLQDPVFNTYFVSAQTVATQRLVADGNPQGFVITFSKLELKNATFPLVVKYSTDPNKPSLMATYYDETDKPYGTNIINPNDFVVTISSYSEQVLNASFSGRLYSSQTPVEIATISNGTINLYLIED